MLGRGHPRQQCRPGPARRPDDRPGLEDHAEYRLPEPEELSGLLAAGGFEVLGLYDNRALEPSDLRGAPGRGVDPAGLRGRKLYVLARAR